MKNLIAKTFLLFILTVTLTPSALGWDDAGHKISTYIAWEQMTPTAREAAAKILLAAPEDSDLSVFYSSDSRSVAARQRELFMIASTWADIVRERKFKIRNAKYHHGSWHYLDTFWRETSGKIEIVPELKSAEENAVERLFTFEKVLRDTLASDADKAIALAWILHVGGDIHQPLHASARVTEYDPKGDQGGNLFVLSPKGATGEDRVTLHWYWDSIVGRNIARTDDACDSNYLVPIALDMMKKHPAAKMRGRLEIGQFNKWQAESFQIASTKLYPPSLKFGEMPSEDYKKMAFETAQERIALAGYRLGEMLNRIFGGQDLTRNEYDREKSRNTGKVEKTERAFGTGVNDRWLFVKAKAALKSTEGLRDSTINVIVENSIVTLTGTVSSKQQSERAATAAKGIDGVKQVKNLLKILPNTNQK